MNILDELVAKGVSGERIIEVAKLIADSEELQKLRAEREQWKDSRAAYMREWRVKSRDSHVISREVTQPPSLSTTTTSIKKDKKLRERGTRLSAEWQPDADDCAYAAERRLDPKTIAIDFRDYWHARAGPGAVKMNWKLTWQRWCRNEKGNGNGRAGQARDERHSISATFDKIFEKLASGDGASVVPFEANPRLLQNRRRE